MCSIHCRLLAGFLWHMYNLNNMSIQFILYELKKSSNKKTKKKTFPLATPKREDRAPEVLLIYSSIYLSPMAKSNL